MRGSDYCKINVRHYTKNPQKFYFRNLGSETINHEEAKSNQQEFSDAKATGRCFKNDTATKGCFSKTGFGIF